MKYFMIDQRQRQEECETQKIIKNIFFIVVLSVMTIFILQTLSEGIL